MPNVREMFLLVRVNDEASRQLRTIGTNMRMMGRSTDFATARNRLLNQQSLIQSRLMSAQTKQTMMQRKIDEKIPRQQLIAGQTLKDLNNTKYLAEQKLQRLEAEGAAARNKFETEFVAHQQKLLTALQAQPFYKKANVGRRANLEQAALAKSRDSFVASNGKALRQMELMAEAETAQSVRIGRTNTAILRQEEVMSGLDDSIATTSAAMAQNVEAMKMMGSQAEITAGQMKALEKQQALVRPAQIQAAGRALSQAGQHMQLIGGIGLGIAGFAANSAANLQTSTTLAATQATHTLKGIRKIGTEAFDAIIQQMHKFPASADEMSKSLYDIFSGTNVQNIDSAKKLLVTFNQAAVAGQTDLNTATNAGITVLNDYGVKVKDMPSIMNKMFAAVRFGRTTFSEFGASLGTLVPAFKNANQSIDVMFGSLAFMTRRIPSVRAASISLSRATEILGNAKFVDGMKKAGVVITDVHHALLPLPTVLDRIAKKFPQLTKTGNIQNFLKTFSGQSGTIQARRALTFLFRDLGQYHQMLKQVNGDSGEFSRSFKGLASTQAVQWKTFLNGLKADWLELGRAVIPTLVGFAGPLQKITQGLANMSPATQQMVGKFTAWGLVALIVLGTITRMIGGAASLIATLAALKIQFAETWAVALGPEIALVFGAFILGAALAVKFGGGLDTVTAAQQRLYNAASAATTAINLEKSAMDTLAGKAVTTAQARLNAAAAHATMVQAQSALHTARTSAITPSSPGGKKITKDEAAGIQAAWAAAGNAVIANDNAVRTYTGDLHRANAAADQAAQIPKTQAHNLKLVAEMGKRIGDLTVKQTHLAATNRRGTSLAFQNNAKDIRLMTDRMNGLITATSKVHLTPKTIATFQRVLKTPGLPKSLKVRIQAVIDNFKPAVAKQGADAKRALAQIFNRPTKFSITADNRTALQKAAAARKAMDAFANKEYRARATLDISSVTTALGTAVGEAEAAGQNIASALANGTVQKLKAHSPSKVYIAIGKDVIRGLKIGTMEGAKTTGAAIGNTMSDATVQAARKRNAGKNRMLNSAFLQNVDKPWLAHLHKLGIKLTSMAWLGTNKAMKKAAPFLKAMGIHILEDHQWAVTGQGIGRLIAAGISDGLAKESGGFSKAMTTIATAMQDQFTTMRDNLQGQFGDLFTGTPQNQILSTVAGFGGAVPMNLVTGDLRAQLGRFRSWTRALRKLQARGIPGALYQQLLALGPDGLPEVLALASSSKKELAQYTGLFKQEQKAVSRATQSAFSEQVKLWKKMGKNVAFGILAGLRSETPGLLRFMRHLAAQMFATVQHHNKSHSPSKLYAKEGKNMLDGLQMGMRSYQPSFSGPVGVSSTGPASHHTEYHYHQHLERKPDQSEKAFMRGARFDYERHLGRRR